VDLRPQNRGGRRFGAGRLPPLVQGGLGSWTSLSAPETFVNRRESGTDSGREHC
jgi:hypothetical protein